MQRPWGRTVPGLLEENSKEAPVEQRNEGEREREGDGEGTGQAAQSPVGHIGDLGSCLQGGGTQEGCGQRRGPDSCSRVPSGGCSAEDRFGGVGAIFHLVQDGG